MLTVKQNLIVVAATVLGSLLFMLGLNRVWPWEKRRAHNAQLSILGTTYAVILGFMLYAVWSSLQAAELNAGLEANAIVDISRLADALPEPQRTQLHTLARSYVDAVINQEWPQMAKGEIPEKSTTIEEMWKTAISVRPTLPIETHAQEHVMSELDSITQYRLTRILQSTTHLPNVLWCVLLVGGVLTIISACTFGTESVMLQTLQVFCLSLLVSLSLVAISDIHRPFHGLIHVSDYAFRRAQQSM